MKILVFGGSGQIGFELQRSLCPLADLVVPGFNGVPRVNLADMSALEKCVVSASPDIVINAAAFTSVDKAETERAAANAINAIAPGVIARSATAVGAAVIHFSTDYVFNGEGNRPWLESDKVAPLNYYGESKLAGEAAILSSTKHSLIFRTSWVYSTHGNNFPKTMLRLASNKQNFDVVCDQFGAPTGAPMLADLTAHAVLRINSNWSDWGVYHLVAGGETTWSEFAKFLFAGALEYGLLDKFPLVSDIASLNYKAAAKRPTNSRLNTNKFKSNFNLQIPDWKSGVEHFLRELSLVRK